MLILVWLLLIGVVPIDAPPPPAGTSTCDLNGLPTRLESAELACCSDTACLLTSSSVCSLQCAQVLTPLLQSCSAELLQAGATSLVTMLGPACEKAVTPTDSGSGAVGTNCEYADFLPVTMACVSYLKLSSAALDVDASFCYSTCFEQAFAFHARCADKMTFAMRYALGAVETEVEKPNPRCAAGGGGYDGTDTLICEATGAAAVVSAACSDASKLLPEVQDGTETAEALRKAMCNSECTTSIAGLSTACKHDPVFAQVIDIADDCKDIHENSQCVDVADRFQEIVKSECCSSPSACTTTGAVPDTCSVQCSMSVLPFLERCGAALNTPQTTAEGTAGSSYMNQLAALCAPHRRT